MISAHCKPIMHTVQKQSCCKVLYMPLLYQTKYMLIYYICYIITSTQKLLLENQEAVKSFFPPFTQIFYRQKVHVQQSHRYNGEIKEESISPPATQQGNFFLKNILNTRLCEGQIYTIATKISLALIKVLQNNFTGKLGSSCLTMNPKNNDFLKSCSATASYNN